jgi:hypothetical protein
MKYLVFSLTLLAALIVAAPVGVHSPLTPNTLYV